MSPMWFVTFFLTALVVVDPTVCSRSKRIVAGNVKVTLDLLNVRISPKPSNSSSECFVQIFPFQKLSSSSRERNVFFSPTSVDHVMGMIFLGSSGRTAGQIKKVFMLERNKEKACRRYSRVTDSLQRIRGVTLETANRVYMAEDFLLLPEYQRLLNICFQAQADRISFRRREEAADKINAWVQSVTHNKIKNLIEPSQLDSSMKVALINGIYFKAKWETEFNAAMTTMSEFRTSDYRVINNVPMMQSTSEYFYDDIDDFYSQAIMLPYKGNRLSMLVILPRYNNGLQTSMSILTYIPLEDLLRRMKKQIVKVEFPRFKMETFMELSRSLKQMGVKDVFNPKKADLSLISGKRNLFISLLIQKAYIEINEKGTEAAAVTGGFVALSAANRPLPMPIFQANRPFLFFILDQKQGIILFAGKVENPLEETVEYMW